MQLFPVDTFQFRASPATCCRAGGEKIGFVGVLRLFAMKNKNLMDVLLHSYVTCGGFNMLHKAHITDEYLLQIYCAQEIVLSRFVILRSSIKLAFRICAAVSCLSISAERCRQRNVKIYRPTSQKRSRDLLLCEQRICRCADKMKIRCVGSIVALRAKQSQIFELFFLFTNLSSAVFSAYKFLMIAKEEEK